MSTITKEHVRERLTYLEGLNARGVGTKVSSQQFEIACLRKLLASLEAEPVADVVAWSSPNEERTCDVRLRRHDINPGPLYAAPPATVSVPDGYRLQPISEYDAMCAAMLQGANVSLTHEGKNHTEDKPGMVNHLGDANENGNSPVIPDGWVACSERMPEQFKAILAFNEYGEVWSGAYDRYWNFYCDNLLVEHVTHWMPLPAAPQQEVK